MSPVGKARPATALMAKTIAMMAKGKVAEGRKSVIKGFRFVKTHQIGRTLSISPTDKIKRIGASENQNCPIQNSSVPRMPNPVNKVIATVSIRKAADPLPYKTRTRLPKPTAETKRTAFARIGGKPIIMKNGFGAIERIGVPSGSQ